MLWRNENNKTLRFKNCWNTGNNILQHPKRTPHSPFNLIYLVYCLWEVCSYACQVSKSKYGNFGLRINMTPQARRRCLSTCEKRKALTFWLLGVVLSPHSFLSYLCSDLFTSLLPDFMMTTSCIYLAIKCKCTPHWRVDQITTIQ